MPSRSHKQPRRRSALCDDDGGFTILEVVMAIVVITIAMTALATFFVNSAKATDTQSQRQTATQVATDAMEQARSLSGIGAYSKRDKTTSDLLWAAGQNASSTSLFRGVAPFLTHVAEAYDTTNTLSSTSGYTAPLPICVSGTTSATTCTSSGATITLDSVKYTRNWFIGYCYASVSVNGGACSAANATGLITYLQVVIDVTWPDNDCTNNLCSYVTATRISPTPDPTFDASQSAPKPRIHNPGDQTNDVGQTVSLTISYSGGTAPLTWQTPTGLPTGLAFSTASGSPVISSSGALTSATTGPVTVTLKVTDAFGFTSTAAFKWTVYARPALTNPGARTTTRGTTGTSVDMSKPGGAPPLTYSATGLPTNMSIDPSTGVITGTPSTTQTKSTTVTVTDKLGISTPATFSWSIVDPPTVGIASTYLTAEQASPSVPIPYSCANPPCVITLSGAVPGLGLDTAIDNNTDHSSATSLTVTAAGPGTAYLNGQVTSSAVSGSGTTNTKTYSTTVKIADASAVTASASSTGTARVYPSVYSPGHITVGRNTTVDQTVSVRCNGSCTVAVVGTSMPTGVGIAAGASTTANSNFSLSTSGALVHLTGRVSSTAPLGTSTITITVTNTISGTSYSISSVGVWTVTP